MTDIHVSGIELEPGFMVKDANGRLYVVMGLFHQPSVVLKDVLTGEVSHLGVFGAAFGDLRIYLSTDRLD